MALSRLLQSNFAGGEASPSAFASGDLDRYAGSLAKARNLIVRPLGPAERRGGSVWVADPADVTKLGRLLPFARDVDDAVAIVVQNTKLRFIDALTRSYILSGMSPLEI